MRWALELVSGPEIEVIDLARMKRELREFSSVTSRDDDITAKIKAAREWIEDYTGRVLVDETWKLTIDHTGELEIEETTPALSGFANPAAVGVFLRRSPALAIVSVYTVDAEGDETLVDDGEYEIQAADSKWPYVVPRASATWSSANLRITFRAGFADRTGSPQDDATVVPERFKEAMILWVKSNYDGDDAALEAAKNLARPLRAHVGFA